MRRRVRTRGRQKKRRAADAPDTARVEIHGRAAFDELPDELLTAQPETGTHSIIDMAAGVSPEAAAFAVAPLTPHQLEEFFGTERPSHMPIIDSIALERAISELPPGYRTVFVLHDVEGYEHEEVARMLGCTVGTSKSQLHKARMRIRALLGKKAAIQD